MTFELDTSGHVLGEHPNLKDANSAYAWRWSDLSPFAQGYGRALAQELYDSLIAGGMTPAAASEAVAFRNWHPDTLAAILRDCEALTDGDTTLTASNGACSWSLRQGDWGRVHGFPPLAPFLDDEGRVRLREAP